MFYPLLKALTKIKSFNGNLISADYLDEGYIYMIVPSFGLLYGITIRSDRVDMEIIKVFYKDYHDRIIPITEPQYLAVIFSFLEICWPDLYSKLFKDKVNEFNLEYLKANIRKIDTDDIREKKFSDIYLGIFALMGIPKEGGTLTIGDTEMTMVYSSDGPDLELEPQGIDWAYMGRGLWYHLCKIISEKNKI